MRACVACHAAKVKCIKTNGTDEEVCTRCQRLGLNCELHVSRQGQGPRRNRKKYKLKEDGGVVDLRDDGTTSPYSVGTAGGNEGSNKLYSRASSSASVVSGTPAASPLLVLADAANASFSGNSVRKDGMASPVQSNMAVPTGGMGTVGQFQPQQQNQPNLRGVSDMNRGCGPSGGSCDSVTNGMSNLRVEDEIVCKGLHNLGYNHYGLHHLLRMWVALAFTRRSFNLLARASFLAARCGISMDDILSSQSPFVKVTNTAPMSFLPLAILLPKEQQDSLGPRLDLREMPWDLLQAVHIDPRLDETTRSRWFTLQMTMFGKIRMYSSPNFERDLATTEEMEKVWLENKREMIDLFMPLSAKKSFATSLLNHLYLSKEPNMDCYVTRCQTAILIKSQAEPVDVDCFFSMKVLDMDTSINFIEFKVRSNKDKVSDGSQQASNAVAAINDNNNASKRQRDSIETEPDDEDPLMSEDFDFTELPLTDELEAWLNILGDEENPKASASSAPFL